MCIDRLENTIGGLCAFAVLVNNHSVRVDSGLKTDNDITRSFFAAAIRSEPKVDQPTLIPCGALSFRYFR